MKPLDWAVIVAYLFGVLAIGSYYSRTNKSGEDYLLGARSMRPFSVGLSLFASLLSTLSYLAFPGEMVHHGPLAFAKILPYPIVFVVVGYLMIPRFMKLNVTSAYEILERRFDWSVRMLGSAMFLVVRLLWMGVVVYVTTDKVLTPLLRLPDSATPYLCFVIGFITVIYTTVGGMRAVVATDAIQAFVLLFGALLVLLVASFSLGGVVSYWPTEWPAHWDEFNWGFDLDSRFTLMTGALTGMVWWICTAGSDQVAIQRYLATYDPSAGRRMLGVSLFASAISTVLLALVGLALLAYFQARPELLTPGVDLEQNADRLFPYFIVVALPPGITGLVIAGLLAAAMSSLSSGLNSSSLVIAVDFFERWGWRPQNEAQRVRRTKTISWIVGAVVVVVSSLVGLIEGNLLEVAFKTANLLVAPLFILFFMALFVPWATVLGTWTATIFATLAAIRIAYYEDFGLGVVWIMPVSLLVGILAGCLASWLPFSRRCPMLEVGEPAARQNAMEG